MMNAQFSIALLLIAAAAASAAPRTSANYSISVETVDSGGGRAASANYAQHGGAGFIAGVSAVAVPAESARHGYIAQLFEVTDFLINAAAPTVDETATLQLGAWHLLDDATWLRLPANSVAWSVVSGPVTGITTEGVATADIVYQDTAATVQGALAGDDHSVVITVLDSLPDNFGAYAGDGLGDGWQVQYFGLDNPLAAPALDPDGDGQANLFEYIAGLVPTDPVSVFRLRIENVPGQPSQKSLIFSPRWPDRTYIVKARPSLLEGVFAPLESFSFADDGEERTVTDLDAAGLTKFYTVEITKP